MSEEELAKKGDDLLERWKADVHEIFRKNEGEEMNENEKLRRAFIATTVTLIIAGIIFIITMVISLAQINSAVEETKANKYDLNCLTQVIEKPLTECKE